MRTLLRGWRYLYGENPMHLLVLLGCFALIGATVSMVYTDPSAWWLLVWFLGAVIAHDLVLYPLYALADGSLLAGRWARRRLIRDRMPRVPAVNHFRLPVLGSAVLGLIYLPTITQRGETAFRLAAGRSMEGYLETWLLITGVLFLVSAVLYALRLGLSLRRGARTGS